MSRYFKYKTPADQIRDAERLGLRIRLSDDFSHLRRPATVAGRHVGNRLAIHPMEGCDATPAGDPDSLTLRRYERFGAGGAKLIWGEAAAVVPEGRANTRQLVIDEARASGLESLLLTCRQAHRQAWGSDDDLLVGLQLTHSGRYSVPRPILAQHDPLLDPLTFLDRKANVMVSRDHPLISDDELDRLQDRYVEAASVALKVGFDFIDIKQCHRYLLNELLSAETRPGRYGGSLENRTRFIRDVVGRIRDVHPTALIATRLNVYDGVPYRRGDDGVGIPHGFDAPVRSAWGTNRGDPFTADLAEPLALIAVLRKLGVGLLNVSMGNPYASPHLVRPFEYTPIDGYETPEHPLVGVDRHFRLTAEIQAVNFPIWRSSAPDIAGSKPDPARRCGERARTETSRSSASAEDRCRNRISRARCSKGKPSTPSGFAGRSAIAPPSCGRSTMNWGNSPTGCPPFDKEVYGPIWKEAEETRPS